MFHAHIVIEIPTRDEYAERLIASLHRTFEYHCPELQYELIPKYEFVVERTFELGARAIVQLSTEIPCVGESWQIYLSPRHMTFHVNSKQLDHSVSGVLMAVAKKKMPAALFLCTVMTDDLPPYVEEALYHKVDAARRTNITAFVQPEEDQAISRIRDAVVKGYVGAIVKSAMN